MAKHFSNPHQNTKSLSVAAVQVLNDYKKKLEDDIEEVRQDYENQLIDKANDDWLRNLATTCLVYYEVTGSKQKTEKFAQKLAEKLEKYKAMNKSTQDIVNELSRATDIELEVQY